MPLAAPHHVHARRHMRIRCTACSAQAVLPLHKQHRTCRTCITHTAGHGSGAHWRHLQESPTHRGVLAGALLTRPTAAAPTYPPDRPQAEGPEHAELCHHLQACRTSSRR